MTVREAVDRYLEENKFDRAEYTASHVPLKVGPLMLRFPNGKARQRAIPLHDMHHALTGYGTDLVGEAEIGAWEMRAGCTNLFLYAINLTAVIAGVFLSPRRVLAAFRAGRGSTSLYALGLSAEEYDAMSVDELRRRAGIPEGGVADRSTRKLAWGDAPAV